MSKPMLPANEQVLRARFPVALQRIKAVGDRMPDSFFYEDTPEGSCLMIQRGENAFPAYGSHKPSQLIKRWFNGLTMAKEALYSISGFGDGSHLRHFMNESSSGTNFMAAEKDPALLRETFSRFDCSDILNHERFILGVGEPDDDYFRDIQGAALSGVNDINGIIFSPLHSVDEGYYDRMRNELVRQYLVIRPLMEVNVRTATDIQENTFLNLPHLAHAPDVGELKGGLEDIPFILIGAGPSLDESIDFLREVQDKAIIVASNTPYRKLINNGIRPHLVVTADPLSPTLAGFQNITLEGVPLACPFSAYPEIVKRFSGRILTWCTFNPIVDVLREQTGGKTGTKILEKGTVSACVLGHFSKAAGIVGKCYLVGQDMAMSGMTVGIIQTTLHTQTRGAHYASTDQGPTTPREHSGKSNSGRAPYLSTSRLSKQFISETATVDGVSGT